MHSDLQHHIARAVLPPRVPMALGSITLLPHQVQAVHRLRRALSWFRGALLADDVGLGKTFTALALATGYDHVHVLAPAGLLPMWRSACTRSGLQDVRLHSLHAASRRCPDLGPASPRTLIIIDEAHALRNAATARYRHVAVATSGSHVLLLSATPLHNARTELSALVGLFWGERQEPLSDDDLARLVVRRDTRMLRASAPTPTNTQAGAERPRIRAHRPIVMPQHRATLDRIMALPAPLPARDGAVAGALIRMGLLRAWCSSDAALTHALTRRILRSEALRAALQANRHPTQEELRAWALGDDHMQLAFPELMAAPAPQLLPPVTAVQQHIDALQELRALHVSTANADEQRARVLRALRRRRPDTPIIAFSQYTRTVQALYRALSDIAGVGMIAGNTAQIASGRIPRGELLEHFAPRAHGRPPPPPHRAIMLLIATDLLAEGVNLQDAGIVVHLDMPWTPALRTQRVGRVARIGSPHERVDVYRLTATAALRRALRVEEHLARKLQLTRRFVGGQPRTAAPRTHSSAADSASLWIARLDAWWTAETTPSSGPGSRFVLVGNTESMPGLSAAGFGAIVLIRTMAGPRLVQVTCRGRRSTVSTHPSALLRVADRMEARRTEAVHELAKADVARVRRAVARWWERTHTLSLVRSARAMSHEQRTTSVQRRVTRWLQRTVTGLSSVERAGLHREIAEARRAVEQARGAAALDALGVWMRQAEEAPSIRQRLAGWRAHEVLACRSVGYQQVQGDCVIEAILAVTLEA